MGHDTKDSDWFSVAHGYFLSVHYRVRKSLHKEKRSLKVIVAEGSLPRTEPNGVVVSVLKQLENLGIDVPLLELDDDDDNLFFSVNHRDLHCNAYLRVRLDSEYYSNTPVYFIEPMLRQHSGGDISYVENQTYFLEFLPSEMSQNIQKVCDIYMAFTRNA